MMHRSLFFAVVVVILLGLAGWDNYPQSVDNQNTNVQLSITATKETYVLGEIVTLNLRVQNDRSNRIRVGVPDHGNTYITFYVSRDGENFLSYLNRYHGGVYRSDGKDVMLGPGESVEGTTTLIWNTKPVVHHLNPDAARRVQEGKILTDYALPEPGTYYIKAAFRKTFDGNLYARPTKVESEPIEITIEEPEGQDLDAWNAIKDREEIAYFLQEGSFRGSYKSVGERRSREYDGIVDRYPNSVIGTQLRQKLREYRARVGIIPKSFSDSEKN